MTKDSNTSTINLNAPSAIAGAHSTSTSTKLKITAFIASPIAVALLAITPQNATIPSPIFSMINGIRFAIEVMIIVNDVAMAVAPTTVIDANVVNATAIADKPAPAAIRLMPIPNIPTPTSVNAAANPSIVGISGVKTAPAIPIIVNAPAIAIKPLTIDSQLIEPRIRKTGTNAVKAATATTKAAEPIKVPRIALSPIAKITIEPPKAVRPLPISFHDIFPILLRELANMVNAVEIAIKPRPMPIVFFGINFIAIETANRLPAIPASPFAKFFQDIPPISLIADANIFIAEPNIIIATPVVIIYFAFPVTLVNIANSVSNAAIETKPFLISFHFMSPKFSTAFDNISNAEDKITIPIDVRVILPLNLAAFKNIEISAIKTPIATNPFIISLTLIDDIFFNAPANITTAILIPIIRDIALVASLKLVDILLKEVSDPNN